MRYLLVDRVDELEPFVYAVGVKCITLSDDSFEHHFPGHPVYSGALLLESMAQLGGMLLEFSLREVRERCPRCVLSSVKAKFRELVRPGDVVVMRADVVSHHEGDAVVKIRAEVAERCVAEAEALYVYFDIDDPELDAARRKYVEIATARTKVIR